MPFRFLFLCFLVAADAVGAAPTKLADLWRARLKSVVAVEFFTETESDRRPSQIFGTVIDGNGTIIFPSEAIGNRVSPDQLKDFRVYLPGAPTTRYFPATYLGHDEYSGWEFVRVNDAAARAQLVPVTQYGVAPAPEVADELWGIGLRKKDEDFAPYFLSSRVSIVRRLPQWTALMAHEVAGLSLPVFDQRGAFVGLTVGGFGQSYLEFSNRDRGGAPIVLVNPDECAAVVLASELLPSFLRIPKNIEGRPLVWLGAGGLEPLDPEVAHYLHLDGQAGLVVGEVLEGSPAAAAGLRERDILLAVDGQPLPALKPDRVVVNYFQREVDRRRPGDVMRLGVLRGDQRLNLDATLQDAPQLPREAPRKYFENIGLTVRGFTFVDGAARRVRLADQHGVVAHFVKAGSPLATAGLRTDDWIKEIDGNPVKDFDGAVKILTAIENDPARSGFTLGVERGGVHTVLQVKLK